MKTSKRLLAVLLSVLLVLSCLTGPVLSSGRRKGASSEAEDLRAAKERPQAEEALPEAREGRGKGFQSQSFRANNTYRYADDEIVTAIVLLEGEAEAEVSEQQRAASLSRMAAQRTALRNALRAAGISCTETFEYHTLLNGVALQTAYGNLEKIAAISGVERVHIANRYAPPEVVKMESSNEMTGLAGFQRSGYNGSGTVIAVLDTGITPSHEAFGVYDGMLEQAALTENEAEAAIEELGYGAWLSEKIPFSYDYADMDDDATDDSSGHGTHVSGIAAGYAETWDGAASFIGSAPDAQILAMKIFSDWGGTDSSIYFKALEDAYLLGADVINMSIGAQNGFTYDQELEDEVFGNIYETLAEHGVAIVVAAGNEDSMAANASTWAGPGLVTSDYADYGVVGSPATYGRNLAVASAENAEYPMHYIEAGGRKILYYDADGNQFFNAFGGEENLEFAVIPGYGTREDFQGVMVEGRIALISRGEISFQEKVENAAFFGAVGALIYNNDEGVIYMAIDWYDVPAASITKEDGEYLKSLAQTVEPESGTAAVKAAPQADGPRGMGWSQVTEPGQLTAGRYLLVNELSDHYFNGSAGSGINAKNNFVTFEDLTEDAALTFDPETGSFMTPDGLYICGEAGSNKIVVSEEEVGCAVTFDEDGYAVIVSNETQFAYNADWPGFRFYKADSQVIANERSKISLYRLDDGEPEVFEGDFRLGGNADLMPDEDGNNRKVILYNPASGMVLTDIACITDYSVGLEGSGIEIEGDTVTDPPMTAVWEAEFYAPEEAGEPPHLSFRNSFGDWLMLENGDLQNYPWGTIWDSLSYGEDSYTLYSTGDNAPYLTWDEEEGLFLGSEICSEASELRFYVLDGPSEPYPEPEPDPEPSGDAFWQTNYLEPETDVVIVHAATGLALSAEADGYYRKGVEVTVYEDYGGYLENPDPSAIWTVSRGEGASVIFTDAEGHQLSMEGDYNSLPSDAEYNEWALDFLDDSSEDLTCFVVNMKAPVGEAGDLKALEYYKGHFTAYYLDKSSEGFAMLLFARRHAYPAIPTDIGSFSFPEDLLVIESETGWLMSDFSSWGVTPDLQLKPMITGIGGNVWSAEFMTEDGYCLLSGTSMATPNVAGAMADTIQLIREKYPDVPKEEQWQTAEALLESTARILTDRGEERDSPYSPRKQGAGLIDLTNAARARAYIEDPVLSLGGREDGVFEISFTVHSLYDADVTYAVSTLPLIDAVTGRDWDEDGRQEAIYNTLVSLELEEGFTLAGPDTVTVPANGTAQVTLTLELGASAMDWFREIFPNGNFLDGFVRLTEQTVQTKAFDDVQDPAKFYYEPVYWAVAHNPVITTGTSETAFSPNKACTRAQVVTFLWRAAGEPEPKSTNCPFTDVKESGFYYKAMLWAVENGITAGTSETTFSPNKTATRAQVVTFLHRFAGEPEPESTDCPFTDVKESGFYYKAMLWAVENEITNGISATAFGPNKDCTRGHVVTFLYRLLAENEEKPMIHASFTGFFGDWTAAPILESHDWREIVDLDTWLNQNGPEGGEETYADLGYTYLDFADFEINTDVNLAYSVNLLYLFFGFLYGGYAGDNLYDFQPYSENHIAISPNGITDTVYALPMMLRNARHVIMTVTDAETGELYMADDSEYVPKAYFDTDYGYWSPSYGYIYTGTDLAGEYLPGGTKVDVKFYANPAYGEDELGALLGDEVPEDPEAFAAYYGRLETEGEDWLVWTFPVTVDDTEPTLGEVRYDPEAKTLRLTASDDQYLAAVGLYKAVTYEEEDYEYTEYELAHMAGFSDDAPGQAHEVVLENVEPGEYILAGLDYATNECDLGLILGDGAALCAVEFSYPENCYIENYVETYWVSEGSALKVPGLDAYLDEGSFAAWLTEPLDGILTYEELEETGLAEAAIFPGEEWLVETDMTFYALFEYASEWSDPDEMIRDCWESRNKYEGSWAFSGYDWRDYDGDFFLNDEGAAERIETVYEDPYSYLLSPQDSILFDLTYAEDSDEYAIRSRSTGKYLVVENGELAFTDEEQTGGWYIWWDDWDETFYAAHVESERYLVFDVADQTFKAVNWVDSDIHWLLMYGSFPIEYSYFTDPDLLTPAG